MALDLVQSVAYLAFAAGGASDIYATPNTLTNYLAVYLNGGTVPDGGGNYTGFFPWFNSATYPYQLIGGDWDVVWGPIVIGQPNVSAGYAANSMYVAYSSSQDTYVVSVAGTDFDSLYDWFYEDGNVSAGDMVDWPIGSSSNGAKISGATNTGLQNLLGMTNPTGFTLQQFLDNVNAGTKGQSRLIFTGHSLGGALAPTLALYLYPDPSTSGWQEVNVLALAGPTPGNQQFAQTFNAAYPQVSSGDGGTYPYWNTNYQNYADMVPRAWNRLQSIAPPPANGWTFYSIWGKLSWSVNFDVQQLITAVNDVVKGAGYWRINYYMFKPDWGYFDPGATVSPVPPQTWPYPPDWPTWTPWPQYGITNPISSTDQLETLITGAHLDQYYRYFGLMPIPHLPVGNDQAAARATAKAKKNLLVAAARVGTVPQAQDEQYQLAEEADDPEG